MNGNLVLGADGFGLLEASLAVPLLGAGLIWLTGSRPNQRETVTLVTAVSLFACVLSIAGLASRGVMLSGTLATPLPGIAFFLQVEPLGVLFAVVASGLWIVTSVYSIGYMRGNAEAHQTRFYVCFALALASVMGIAFSGNLVTLFVFYEALTLSTYPLVAHHGDAEARRGARTYIGVLMATSIGLLLLGVVLVWDLAGTTDFRPGGILDGHADRTAGSLLLLLFLFGIGKAAVMPVHRWLPAAMVAPTPVSALLHAVAVVKAGVFTVLKVAVYTFGTGYLAGLWSTPVAVALAGFTIVVASLIALRQDNLKRRLAYSTVSQLSYVVMATLVLAPLSVAGAALHIAVHAVSKITLFFAAGAIYTAAHKTEVSQLAGIGRRMPWTMCAFAIGALSLVGVPPMAGFISKWYMLLGAYGAHNWFAIGVIALSTLLNAAYFLPIVHAAFLKPLSAEDAAHPHGEAPWPSVLALGVSAGLTVLLFFFPDWFLALAKPLGGL